jgi:hypothetical protein
MAQSSVMLVTYFKTCSSMLETAFLAGKTTRGMGFRLCGNLNAEWFCTARIQAAMGLIPSCPLEGGRYTCRD